MVSDRAFKVHVVKTKHFSGAIARVRQMNLDQKVQSLIDSGILTRSGKRLAKPYRADGA